MDFLPEDLSPWDFRTRFKALAEGPLRVRRRPAAIEPIGAELGEAGTGSVILFKG